MRWHWGSAPYCVGRNYNGDGHDNDGGTDHTCDNRHHAWTRYLVVVHRNIRRRAARSTTR
jgi:hypothetical protein